MVRTVEIGPLVGPPYRHLILPLGGSVLPVVGNRPGGAFVQVLHGVGLAHSGTLTDCFLISHGEYVQCHKVFVLKFFAFREAMPGSCVKNG